MKTLQLLAIGIILLLSSSINAQVSVNLNIGTAPNWGPRGYSNVEYYYLPEIQAYYDIRASQFIYFGRNQWIRSRYLPREYRNYDLYRGYKVVLNDYHGHRPYSNYKYHSSKYNKRYRGNYQNSIGHRKENHRKEGYRYSKNRRYTDNHRESNERRYSNDRRSGYDKKDKHRNQERNDRERK